MIYDVIIIGGGAAGFMAASFLSDRKVLIIEKNPRFMHKLAITGKGRCNLTNNCDTETLLNNIPKNAAFMRSAFTKFPPCEVMEYFEGLGVPLKTERGGRVFPISDKAGDVAEALRKSCNAETVNERAVSLLSEGNAVVGVSCGKAVYRAGSVLVATGGMSYPATGSTGDGYKLAQQAGHTVIPPRPALVPLETVEDVSEAAGLTLKNVKLTAGSFSETGELLFTHFGVSGPLVLSASWYAEPPCTVSIDFKPALDEKTLDSRILRDFSENKNRLFRNSLHGLLPESIIPMFVKRSGISPDKQVNEITKSERRRLLLLFKKFELQISKTRPFDEAVITDGGVCVKEVDPKTMQSKLVSGLYFAGEVLDVAGFTGGFNLQIAWSSAYAAANSMKEPKELKERRS
jgi:hypothetical protein